MRLSELVYVDRSPIDGKGVFARVAIKRGQCIGVYRGKPAKRNGKYVLWVTDGRREVGRSGTNELRYLNHSSRPNAYFDGFRLFALTKIPEGREITFDYGEDPLPE